MNAAAQPQPTFDADAYLDWEPAQRERYEFIAGEVFAMGGARDGHNTIALNIASWLRAALRASPCRTFIADMRLRVDAADAFFYPDVMVTCDERDKAPEADVFKHHPLLVVEVLSASTAAFDRGQKFEHYQTLDSLQEYLVVEPERAHVDLFRRGEEGLWVLHPCSAGGTVRLASLGLDLPMDVVYEDVAGTAPAGG